MHKQLMLLGLLLRGSRHGYELNQTIHAHGVIYADMKKANVYYLLSRIAEQGLVTMESEASVHGPRGEKLIYTITDAGRQRFADLLRLVLQHYEPQHSGIEVAIVLLDTLSAAEAIDLLGERRRNAVARANTIANEFDFNVDRPLPVALAADHLLSTVEAEIAWIDRALERLGALSDAGAPIPRVRKSDG